MKPGNKKLRLFFAIKPDADTLRRIDRLRSNLPDPGPCRAVPLSNTHLTLAFLGDTPAECIEPLCHQAAQLSFPATQLTLDQFGWFRRSHVLWLGPGTVPSPLAELASALRQLSQSQGLHVEHRDFRPHVALLRKVSHRPALPDRFRPVTLSCDRFGLYASLSRQGRTHYLSLGHWPLALNSEHQGPGQ